ncbi:hypothetical protein NO559_05240 [Dasania sp. GY-MA-18]|uniref:Orphan protein n=1 Tax=Dasania phycosphaerae TaxID=2950436 RepID=A0A9J6RJQ1_9GAMM|nr:MULTISPECIES: hypothetical protein [Dasania]MCR8922165.1 hypothetical protein [Dasania sp. GY-MA-18]MCZ0864593.1 hypothetical protein [Dasania phycosphaerae]MCZ0868321.1 hypothetical protein [Dasania phycosphaerae]
MQIKLPLAEEKKLTVLSRIEPGCLGPEGIKHVAAFCEFAQKQLSSLDSDFVHWQLSPRHDKNQAEMQYQLSNKTLSYQQAERYLALFDQSLDTFESHLHEQLAQLIDQYLGQ